LEVERSGANRYVASLQAALEASLAALEGAPEPQRLQRPAEVLEPTLK